MKNLVVAIIAVTILTACDNPTGNPVVPREIQEREHGVNNALPPGANSVKYLGNGWVTFDLDGRHFLFRRTTFDRSASDCITELK